MPEFQGFLGGAHMAVKLELYRVFQEVARMGLSLIHI